MEIGVVDWDACIMWDTIRGAKFEDTRYDNV